MPRSYEANESMNPLEEAVNRIIGNTLTDIEYKFGPEGPDPREYHNVIHTRDEVLDAMDQLTDLALERGTITREEKPLGMLGAAKHDYAQGHSKDVSGTLDTAMAEYNGYGIDETLSATAAEYDMRREPLIFTREHTAVVKEIILATRTKRDENGIMTQAVPSGNHLAGLLADADLSSLGRPVDDYWKGAVSLFLELRRGDPDLDPRKFIDGQLRLLTHHDFYTDEARELFPHQSENLTLLQRFDKLAVASLTIQQAPAININL